MHMRSYTAYFVQRLWHLSLAGPIICVDIPRPETWPMHVDDVNRNRIRRSAGITMEILTHEGLQL